MANILSAQKLNSPIENSPYEVSGDHLSRDIIVMTVSVPYAKYYLLMQWPQQEPISCFLWQFSLYPW